MPGPVPPTHACGRLSVDGAGRITGMNETLAAWLGPDADDALGRRFAELVQLRLPRRAGGPVPGDGVVLTRSGPRPVVVGSVDRGADGSAEIVVFDVSPDSEFERPFSVAVGAADRGTRRLQILLNASAGFAEARGDQDAAALLADVARRAFAATAVSVHLLQEDELRFVAGANPLAPHWPRGYQPTGKATYDAGEVFVVPTPDDTERYVPGSGMPDVFRAAGIHSSLAAPIRYKGTNLGSFICYFDHPRTFDEEAVPLAEALANQAAQAIERARLEETLRRLAMLDDLTGLPTRRLLEEQLKEVRRPRDAMLAVLFIDLDGFKAVNDTLGHDAGDRLLAEVATRLRDVVREGELVGRFGGDEFVIVSWVPDAQAAAAMAERLRETIDHPFDGLPPHLRITASIGVALSPPSDALVLDQIMRVADQTMYRSKAAGGDRVSIATV